MKKRVESNSQPEAAEQPEGLSRRTFLTGSGSVSAAVALVATGLMANPMASLASETVEASPASKRVTNELPIPAEAEAPKVTAYQCDVLVIGGGFAGLNAAVAARKAGKSVLLVDKGRPGYSGLSPFPSSHRWFDKEFGDDANVFKESIQRGNEFLTNMSWFQVWIDESKATYERLMEWEILTQYPKASEAGEYFTKLDFAGYRRKMASFDRRAKFIKVLTSNDVPYVEHTMVTDVIQQEGRVVGAMGFDIKSGVVMTFQAKAVVMCTGGGSYKPSGFPTAGNTFDGEYIGYQLGLPIIGKEFDDFHQSLSYAPGNAFANNSWTYLENIWLCGGDISPETIVPHGLGMAKAMILGRVKSAMGGVANNDGTDMEVLSKAPPTRKGGSVSKDPKDPRHGKNNDDMPKGDIWGAAVGMCAHLASGIFCGLDDLVGFTGLPGLYVAGDGANASVVSGAAYTNGVGFTSSFCSIQGWRAGQAAAKYASGAKPAAIAASKVASVTREIQAPMAQKVGHDPNWARDVLQAIMAPYWIHIVKSEATLRSALTQVEFLRDQVVPKLMASCSHELRLCHEMKHKVLSAEMKLRASLARQESRGLHYRSDYPFRDDKNFLCYIAVQKGKDSAMNLAKVEIKEEWKGNLAEEYTQRYGWRFPGEAEAKGLPPEEPVKGGWGESAPVPGASRMKEKV